ncbi:hypothetical protein SAMN05428989_1904 [Pseudoxanthomonas sp. GM95]|uniref:hypothetical protein n=1 Tax=Pseudoxanthomonas sp. GM95 TaxID=1881043 RepID=UPI0008BC6947|nr:hypothetical protein [Pseudoxanthomonas sp. GM95]SEL55115.1 hypothetical protein SAMN05428989_1904 [Pseudoxanthomonas sp. GM95]
MKQATLLVLLSISSTTLACEPGEASVFSCPSNTGPVEVCQAATSVVFRSGDKAVSVPTDKLLWQHDDRAGEAVDDLHFPEAGEVFHVSVTRDRGAAGPKAEVALTKAQKIVAKLTCEAGKTTFDRSLLKATPKPHD